MRLQASWAKMFSKGNKNDPKTEDFKILDSEIRD